MQQLGVPLSVLQFRAGQAIVDLRRKNDVMRELLDLQRESAITAFLRSLLTERETRGLTLASRQRMYDLIRYFALSISV